MTDKEKLEEAKRLYQTANADQRYVLESLFPELKEESEDERIRKAIISGMKALQEKGKYTCFANIPMDDVFTWLERQGEQTDKIVERAKTERQRVLITESNGGANIDWDTRSLQDVKLLLEYGLDYVNKLEKQGEQKSVDKVEPIFEVGDTMRTLQEASNGITEGTPVVVSIDNEYYRCNNETIAIKDQNNYEYPPINKRHNAWSEEDENTIKVLMNIIRKSEMIDSIIYTDSLKEKLYDWLKFIKDRIQPQLRQEWKQENTDDLTDFENAMMHIGVSFFGDNAGLDPNDTNTIRKQAKLLLELVPKQKWSEEDEHWRQKAIDFMKHPDLIKAVPTLVKDTIDWLKSLRPQNRWKVVDKGIYVKEPALAQKKDKSEPGQGFVVCYDHTLTPDVYERYIMLSDINCHSWWKPSDEQIEALGVATDICSIPEKQYDELNKLYHELKKLKGE